MAINMKAGNQIADIVIEEIGFHKAEKLLGRLEREVTANESYKTTIARIQASLQSHAREGRG